VPDNEKGGNDVEYFVSLTVKNATEKGKKRRRSLRDAAELRKNKKGIAHSTSFVE